MLAIFLYMYFPDRGCVHTLLTLYVYATGNKHYSVTVTLHYHWRELTLSAAANIMGPTCISRMLIG